MAGVADRLGAAGAANPDGVRFLLSAHASHEELFLVRRITEELMGPDTAAAVTIGWRYQPKTQPADSKFKVPPVDAPNVNGARIFGFVPGQSGDQVGEADLSALKTAVAAGRVAALFVFDPGRMARSARSTGSMRRAKAASFPCSSFREFC